MTAPRIDILAIADAALASSRAVIPFLLPNGKRTGGEWFSRNPTRADQRATSFSVNVHTGRWHDRATADAGGDLISLWAYLHGLNQLEAARELAAWLRIPLSDQAREQSRNAHPSPDRPRRDEPRDCDGATMMAMARRLWREASDPAFTLTETYLVEERGLALPDDLCRRVVRHHPQLWCKDRQACVPGMLVAYRRLDDPGSDGEPAAVQRWFFDERGRALRGADGKRIKRMLGPVGGACIKLTADEDVAERLIVCEGLETALATFLNGMRPIWALGSAGAIARFAPLSGVTGLTILADHDPNGVGLDAARTSARAWRAAGAAVEILLPQQAGCDAADLIREGA